MFYWEYILISILILPAMLFAIWAQVKVNSAFSAYSQKMASCGLSGSEISKKLLEKSGSFTARVMKTKGKLTDHYNPVSKEIKLSESVYDSSSVAAIGVAAHETGHALQDAKNYFPMKARMAIIKFSNFSSSLFMPLVLIGLVFWFTLASTLVGEVCIWIGVGLFALGALANFVTLPVEVNASRRAMKELKALGVMTNDELVGVKKVLSAAALTYVASLAISLLSLARIVIIALSATNSRR